MNLIRTLKQIYQDLSETDFLFKITDFAFFTERVLGWQPQPFHLEWIDYALKNRRVAIQAPTGFGKTTILGTAFCLWTAMNQRDKEMCIVSKTLPQSTRVLGGIKDAIENNEFLKSLIPKDKPMSNWCSQTYMEVSSGCKIFCRPYSENIKGIHVDYLLGDEVASYDDPQIWYRFVVTRTNAKNGIVIAISTPDNIADLMQELQANPEYVARTYPAIVNGKSIWPDRFPMTKLDKIKNEIGVASFEKEYMCNAKAEVENAVYPPHLLTECFDYGVGFSTLPLQGFTVIGCDFAIASGPRADFDAFVVLNKFGRKSTMLHGETHRGFTIAAKVARLKDLFEMYRPRVQYDANGKEVPPEIAATIKFVIDPSSVGQAIFDELRKEGIPVEAAKFDAINRNAMLINLRQMVENKDLIIPRDQEDPLCMNFTDKLIKELISMMETKTKSGQITYQSKAPHDDTVMALAMACHGVAAQKEFLDCMAF